MPQKEVVFRSAFESLSCLHGQRQPLQTLNFARILNTPCLRHCRYEVFRLSILRLPCEVRLCPREQWQGHGWIGIVSPAGLAEEEDRRAACLFPQFPTGCLDISLFRLFVAFGQAVNMVLTLEEKEDFRGIGGEAERDDSCGEVLRFDH